MNASTVVWIVAGTLIVGGGAYFVITKRKEQDGTVTTPVHHDLVDPVKETQDKKLIVGDVVRMPIIPVRNNYTSDPKVIITNPNITTTKPDVLKVTESPVLSTTNPTSNTLTRNMNTNLVLNTYAISPQQKALLGL